MLWGLGKEQTSLNTAGAYVHLAVGEQAGAFVRISRSVSQNQVKWGPAGRNFLLRLGINSLRRSADTPVH